MPMLTIITKSGDYVEADDRPGGFYLAAHGHDDVPVHYAKLSRKEARHLRDKLDHWLKPKTRKP